MFEIPTTQAHREAIGRAHTERAEAFAAALAILKRPFRALTWPQAEAHRLLSQP